MTDISLMTTSDLIALATGAVTLVGVVLVFGQLRSLTQQTRMHIFAEYTRRYQEIVLNFPEGIHAGDFSLLHHNEYDHIMRYMRAYYDLCFEEWYLHRDGLIESDFWKVWLESIEIALSKPAFQQAWRHMKASSNYGPEFSKFVEERIG